MEKIISLGVIIAILAMCFTVAVNMLPAAVSNDPTATDKAAGQTINSVVDIGTHAIIDDAKLESIGALTK